MKKALVPFCILFFCCLIPKAQEIKVDKAVYDDLILTNHQLQDSLKMLNHECNKLQKEFHRQLKDSLARSEKLISNQKREISKLKKQNDSLHKENARQKNLNCQLKDTLTRQLVNCMQEKVAANGESVLLKKIEDSYKRDFETLITSSSMETVLRDLEIVVNTETRHTLQQLKDYFSIVKSLTQRFDETTNNICTEKLNDLPKTLSVRNLIVSVKSHKDCTLALRRCLDKVMELDKTQAPDDPQLKEDKLNKISGLLTEYIVDYSAFDYPYLYDIINRILERKHTNVNASIKDIYDSL